MVAVGIAAVFIAACRRGVPPADAPLVVAFAGAPADVGRQHGERLGDRVRFLERRYLDALLGGADNRARALRAAAAFRDRLRPRHREELDALAEAAGLAPDRMLLANGFLDLLPSVGCSTITLPAAAAPDGVARFGRNLDFPSFGIADGDSVVMVVMPAGCHAFAAVAWPGLVGVLSGMNEHGLALANMEVAREPRAIDAMPYAILYRTILEECRTVDEAITLLRAEARQTANNLMLMDASGARALVEITPEAVRVRTAADDAPLVGTNHHRGDIDLPGRCQRYDCLAADAAGAWGTIDTPALRQLLDRVGRGDLTLQSMIFEPANGRLHIAVGTDATKRPMHRVDVGGLVRP
jgi:hypothetical protein